MVWHGMTWYDTINSLSKRWKCEKHLQAPISQRNACGVFQNRICFGGCTLNLPWKYPKFLGPGPQVCPEIPVLSGWPCNELDAFVHQLAELVLDSNLTKEVGVLQIDRTPLHWGNHGFRFWFSLQTIYSPPASNLTSFPSEYLLASNCKTVLLSFTSCQVAPPTCDRRAQKWRGFAGTEPCSTMDLQRWFPMESQNGGLTHGKIESIRKSRQCMPDSVASGWLVELYQTVSVLSHIRHPETFVASLDVVGPCFPLQLCCE